MPRRTAPINARVDAARDRARVRVAQEDWEDTREAIAERELWMTKAIDLGTQAAARSVAPAIERRETLAALVARGHRAPARRTARNRRLRSRCGRSSIVNGWPRCSVPARPRRPLVVAAIDRRRLRRRACADGRASFDNTYAARAERLQAAWRAALADVYERATSTSRAVPCLPADRDDDRRSACRTGSRHYRLGRANRARARRDAR